MSRVARLLRPVGLDGLVQTRTYRAIRDPSWTFSSLAISNRERLKALWNSQRGAHGFIVGTGPSLSNVDFSRLDGHPSIGLNRLYLGFDTFGFVPDYLACVNLLMLQQSADALKGLPCQLVTTWAGRSELAHDRSALYLRTTKDETFSRTLLDTVSTGSTVTFFAMQFAYWLGWQSVTLLGIDHNYELEAHEKKAEPHRTVTRKRRDTNHFHEEYMPAGEDWQLPDLESSERAYRRARAAFESDGRRIVDATIGGKLTVFERSPIDFARVPADRLTPHTSPDLSSPTEFQK